MISDLPDILLIQVPKFRRSGFSNDVNMNNGFIRIQEVTFEIVGVLDHVGSSNQNGHWLTWVKLDSGWFKCNDDVITEVNQADTVSSNNYIFACIKTKEPSSPIAHDIAFIENEGFASSSLVENSAEKTEPVMEIERIDEKKKAQQANEIELVDDKYEAKPVIEMKKNAAFSNKVICQGCKGKFSNLIQHLNRTTCKKFYDLAQLKIDAIEKKREKDGKYMKERRQGHDQG